MTTVDEVSSDKTKAPDEFIFRSVLLDCFTALMPNSMSKLIHNRCKKRLNAGKPHNAEQNNLATLLPDLLWKFTYQTSLEV